MAKKKKIEEETEAGEVYYTIEKIVVIAKKGSTVIFQSGKPGNGDPKP